MSRIGLQEVKLPSGVSVNVGENNVTVKGPKGELKTPLIEGITVKQEGDALQVERAEDTKQARSYHGLCRSLLFNAVIGVTEGFKKELEILGVGYRAQVKGRVVEFALGYSHPIEFQLPEGIDVEVEKNTQMTITGIDKQLVGQVAANMRDLRPPEVYKGKGVRYKGEYVQRKVGKAAAGK